MLSIDTRSSGMDESKSPRMIAADRLDGSLLVVFDDGQCGLYSSDLLYATLPQAKRLHDPDAGKTESNDPELSG